MYSRQFSFKSSTITFALLIFLLLSCRETYSEEDKKGFEEEIENFISSQDLEFTKSSSGLYYHIVKSETDSLIKNKSLLMNDEVVFYYKGSFLNGDLFQEIEQKDALHFKVKELIYGWQEALQLIHPRGRIKVIIPPSMGYGDNETELVPANTVLLFDLTLEEVI